MERAAVLVSFLCWVCISVDCTVRIEVITELIARNCNAEHERERTEIMRSVRCNKPREVLVDLLSPGPHIQVIPRAVFLNQCVGLCQSTRWKCMPRKQVSTLIPVRYFDLTTGKESCASYPVVEDVDCACAKVARVSPPASSQLEPGGSEITQ